MVLYPWNLEYYLLQQLKLFLLISINDSIQYIIIFVLISMSDRLWKILSLINIRIILLVISMKGWCREIIRCELCLTFCSNTKANDTKMYCFYSLYINFIETTNNKMDSYLYFLFSVVQIYFPEWRHNNFSLIKCPFFTSYNNSSSSPCV